MFSFILPCSFSVDADIIKERLHIKKYDLGLSNILQHLYVTQVYSLLILTLVSNSYTKNSAFHGLKMDMELFQIILNFYTTKLI